MQDLTTGSVRRHLLKTTGFMLFTMVFQTMYFLVDLYWVGRLGTKSVAAVGIAGNFTFIVLAMTQMLGVGTTTMVSHAVGRKDREQASLVFNQSQIIAILAGVLFLVVGLLVRVPYSNAMSPDPETASLAAAYLLWFVPAMGLQFALVAMGSALRGVGNFKPGMIVSSASVLLNMILAPFLIFGWVTGHAFGVAGAAISSLISIVVAIVWLLFYFVAKDSFLRFVRAEQAPRVAIWKKMLGVGLPSGVEFGIMGLYLVIVYSISRPFGAAAQAGFGIGMRVIQAGFMPVVALGFSVAPVAGQNFGARRRERVVETFRDAALMASAVMMLFALLCHIAPASMIAVFSKDPQVIGVGEQYLRIMSWSFIASGMVFVASSMFQAMGNTIPSLLTSALRISIVAIPAVILSHRPEFSLTWIWYLSMGAGWIQFAASMLLLRREFSKRLNFPTFSSTAELEGAQAVTS